MLKRFKIKSFSFDSKFEIQNLKFVLIIPVINCKDYICVKKKLMDVCALGAQWAHIDVQDGKFLARETWRTPRDLIADFQFTFPNFSQKNLGGLVCPALHIEAHCMINHPEKTVNEWSRAGISRIIVHVEAINLDTFLKTKEEIKCEIGLAAKPETSVEELLLYKGYCSFFLFLAVPPGPSGQQFDSTVLNKIKTLKREIPHATIEVDGGITKETAHLVKIAGADIVASSSYIWESEEPKKAYDELCNIKDLG